MFLLFVGIIILIITLVIVGVMLISACDENLGKHIVFVPVAIMILIGFDIVIYNTDDLRWINSDEITTEYSMIENINNHFVELDNDTKIIFNQGKTFNKKYNLYNPKLKVGDIVQYQYINTQLNVYYIRIIPIININNIDK